MTNNDTKYLVGPNNRVKLSVRGGWVDVYVWEAPEDGYDEPGWYYFRKYQSDTTVRMVGLALKEEGVLTAEPEPTFTFQLGDLFNGLAPIPAAW